MLTFLHAILFVDNSVQKPIFLFGINRMLVLVLVMCWPH